jgi:hypothetical protein
MQGIFGMLLAGGGVILMVGIFTGKITFPLGSPGTMGDSSLGGVTGAKGTTGQTSVPQGKKTTIS